MPATYHTSTYSKLHGFKDPNKAFLLSLLFVVVRESNGAARRGFLVTSRAESNTGAVRFVLLVILWAVRCSVQQQCGKTVPNRTAPQEENSS